MDPIVLSKQAVSINNEITYDALTKTVFIDRGFYSIDKIMKEPFAKRLNKVLKNAEQYGATTAITFERILPRTELTPILYPEGGRATLPFQLATLPNATQTGSYLTTSDVTMAEPLIQSVTLQPSQMHLQSTPSVPNTAPDMRTNFSDFVPKKVTTLREQISFLESHPDGIFTLKELEAVGFKKSTLADWVGTEGSPMLLRLDKERVRVTPNLHRRHGSEINIEGVGTWSRYRRQFWPDEGVPFENARAVLTEQLETAARNQNLSIKKIHYSRDTYEYRVEYNPWRVKAIDSDTVHIVSEYPVRAGDSINLKLKRAEFSLWHNHRWEECDYYKQLISTEPMNRVRAQNHMMELIKSQRYGQAICISQKNQEMMPLQWRNPQSRLVYDGFERTLHIRDDHYARLGERFPSKKVAGEHVREVVSALSKYEFGKIGRAIASVTFKRILPGVSVALSASNIAYAESGTKMQVAAREGASHGGGILGSTATVLGAAALGFTPAGWVGLGVAAVGGAIGSEAATHRMHGKRGVTAMHHNHMPRFGVINYDHGRAIMGAEIDVGAMGTTQRLSEREKKTIKYYYGIKADGEVVINYKVPFMSRSDVIAAGEIILDKGKCIVNNKSDNYKTCGPQIAPFVLEKLSQVCYVDNPTFIYEPGTQYLEREKLPDNCTLPKKLAAGRPQDCLFEAAPKSETTVDSVAEYQHLLTKTAREAHGFYQAVRPAHSRPQEKKLTEAQCIAKEMRARAREINLKNIHLTNLTTADLNKKELAIAAQKALEEAFRRKASAEEIKKCTHDFLQSTATFGDAISKNLASAGFRTASRVLSTVSNGLSGGLAAYGMGKALVGMGFKTLGAAAGPIGIGIAAITTIMSLFGDD